MLVNMSRGARYLLIVLVAVIVAVLIKKSMTQKAPNSVQDNLSGHFVLSGDSTVNTVLDITTTNFFQKHDYFILATDSVLAQKVQGFIETGLQRDSNITPLCDLFLKYGSDKSTYHNYSQIYNFLFTGMKDSAVDVFEVGLGTNNTDVLSNMGKDGKPGASLYSWRDFFSKANVYGADIDKRILFEADRIKTYYVDQLDANSIQVMWQNVGDTKFDLILDDGLHTYEANATFIENSYDHVKSGGFYVIEDIIMSNENILKFYNLMQKNHYPAVLVKIPSSKSRSDNCLLIINKP